MLARIQLVGSNNSRDATNSGTFSASRKDQYFLNTHTQVVNNGLSGKVTSHVSGRQQFSDGPIPASGSGAGTAIRVWRFHGGEVITAFGNTNSTIFRGSNSIGTITGQAKFISETFAQSTSMLFITSTDNTGWFYAQDAGNGSPTFTGDLNSSTSITNVAVTTGIYPGQTVTQANIPANTYITQVSGSTVTISAAATATAAGQTITRTPIAKIYDADFPGNASLTTTGRFAQIDGYVLIMDTFGRIWQADLNSAISWVSNQFVSTQDYIDLGVGIARIGRLVVALSSNSLEFFQNAGNTAGSVLTRVIGAAVNVGCVNQYAYCEYGDTIAFIGRADGNSGVYVLNGTQPIPISDDTTNSYLSGSSLDAARLNVLTSYGKRFLALTLSASSANALVYDAELKSWHPWTLDDPLTQSDTQSFSTTTGSVYVGASNTTYMASQGNVASGTIQIKIDEPRRAAYNSIRLIGDRAASALNIGFSVSYDDGITFSTSRDIDVSKDNQIAYRLGLGRRPIIKLTGLSGVSSRPHRLEAIELDYIPCQ